MKRGDIDFQYANIVVAVKWFDNRGVKMVDTCLEECNIVSTVTRRVDRAPKYLSHAQRLSMITTPLWVVLIFSIKKQLLTNWTVSYLVGVITLEYFFDLIDISKSTCNLPKRNGITRFQNCSG